MDYKLFHKTTGEPLGAARGADSLEDLISDLYTEDDIHWEDIKVVLSGWS